MTSVAAPWQIAVIDDEALNRRVLTAIFTGAGHHVTTYGDGASALAGLDAHSVDVVVLDLRLTDMTGLEVLSRLQARSPGLPVLMLTSHGDIGTAVEAVRRGAYDFLTRPIDNEALLLSVQRAIERRRLEAEVEVLRGRLASDAMQRVIGDSQAMRAVLADVRQVAASQLNVLIVGETGTGKELVARAIHQLGERTAGPFVALDCGAIPESLFESELFGYERGAFSGAERSRDGYLQVAEGGTLFLDEMGNLSLANQAKILRVVQERVAAPLGGRRAAPIDVRFVAASNDDLGDQLGNRFRADLYYRLAEFVIRVPPLRDRRGDIRPLAEHLVAEGAVELRRPIVGLTDGALARLEAHAWPGNVRELRNVVRQAILRAEGPRLDVADLELVMASKTREAPRIELAPGASLKEIADAAAAEAEREAITVALRASGGNKTEAARRLRVDYKTLHLKMKRHGLGAHDDG